MQVGRKNNSVRRSNSAGRRRREKGESNVPRVPAIARVDVEDLVLPDGQCRFQSPRRPKARFATEEKAAKALKQAQLQRTRLGNGHVEKRYYRCPEGGCGGFHLTSREQFDERIWKQRRELHEKRDLGGRVDE